MHEEEVLTKCDYFADVQVWPPRSILDPRGWLSNFRDAERAHAVSLLNAFSYYNEGMVDALYRAAAQALSVRIAAAATSLGQAKAQWRSFLAGLIVTYVEGERPNPTDSGFLFARKARQVLELEESQIMHPIQAVEAVRSNPDTVVLFADDFVGSGNQMRETWDRPYGSETGGKASFSQLASSGSGQFFYAPLIAAWKGLAVLIKECPSLKVAPAHVLGPAYSLTSGDCILWPENLRPTATEFLFEASARAGITSRYEYGWRGFNDLALAVAFWHSVPDATLPMIFWEENDWVPLIRRT